MQPISRREMMAAATIGTLLTTGGAAAQTSENVPRPERHAQDRVIYVTTYVEVRANAIAPGVSLLEAYRDASRKEDGCLQFNVLQEIGRPNRFAVLEEWRNPAALNAHAKAASTFQFRDKLKAIETASYDERINNGLVAGKGKKAAGPGMIYVVTHVDVVPTGKDNCTAALKVMAIQSADDLGNISYDAFQQANRGNHFTVIEAWVNEAAFDAHAAAAHTRAFREEIAPFIGAPYDDRLYQVLN
jgi:quinol monooxygenase YgiN